MTKILALMCVFLLFGCGQSPKQQAEDEVNAHLKEKISKFATAHGASLNWIRIIAKWEDRPFTAHFQNVFLDPQESAFLFPLEISDLVRKDNTYMLFADVSYYAPIIT